MDKDALIRKLCSRKFWVAVVTLVSSLILAFGGNENTAKTVSGCIMASASVIAYTIGEGLADAANVGKVDVYELTEDEEPKE